jgi:hypothetical protein
MRYPARLTIALLAICHCALAESSPAPSAAPDTGIEGIITISPVRGGPSRDGEEQSAPLARKEFVVRQGDRVVTSFTTDDEGRFRVTLPPGRYDVSAQGKRPRIGSWGPFPLEVVAGEMTKVSWNCDSGMR